MGEYVTGSDDDSVRVLDLYDLYVKVAKEKATVKILGKQHFNKFVENYGYWKDKHSNNKLYWDMMTLKDRTPTISGTVEPKTPSPDDDFGEEYDDGFD